MEPANKYAYFSSLVKERTWPIEPDHAISTTMKVQRALESHFIISDQDLVRYPHLVTLTGYDSEDCVKHNLGKYVFISTAKNKCWVVFQKVIIGAGTQAKAHIALEIFSGDVDVLTEQALSDNKRLNRFESQLECLRRVRDKPFVIKFKDYYFARATSGHLFGGIFAKYCPNGDLLDYVNQNTPAPQFIPSLIAGVKNLHTAGIIHRDLKGENVFIDENNEICIGDFGFACLAGTDQQRMGSPAYVAPEVVNISNQISPSLITQKMDIWSLGVLMYTVIYKMLPPHAQYLAKIKDRVSYDQYRLAYKNFNQFYQSLSNSPIGLFLKQFFEIDPAKRPSIHEIKLPDFFLQSAVNQLTLPIPNAHSLIIPEGLAELIQKIAHQLPTGELYDMSALIEESGQLEMTEKELKPYQDLRFFPQNLYSVWVIFQQAVLHTQANRITYLACELFSKQFATYAESTLATDAEETQADWEIKCAQALQGHANIQENYAGFLMEAPDFKISGVFAERMNETLQDRINHNKPLRSRWVKDIINAVKLIHESGYVHRNLRLESLYIRPNDPTEEIIVGDFSNACPANENPQQLVGSLYYLAPELLASPPLNSKAQDIWSLGIIFYCLLSKTYPPFLQPFINGYDISKTEAVLSGMRAFCNQPASVHAEEAFLQQFFVMDPQKRPNIAQIKPFPRGAKRH